MTKWALTWDILFKNRSIATSRRESFVIFLSFANGNGVNATSGLQKYVLYHINIFAALNVHYRQAGRTLPAVDFYPIAPSHAVIFLRSLFEPAGQYRDNPLCTLCARRFSHEIFLVTATSISLLLSLISPRRSSSSFNVLFSSRRRGASETFPSLSRLFTFTLWSRLTFAILFPSSRNILQNIHASSLTLRDLRFSSCTVANIPSRST